MIDVMEPGFATTVQDEGRPGRYRQGIAPSGAMDLRSYRLGNALVGNRQGAAALELTFTGPRLRFSRPAAVAVTGATLPVLINGREMPMWATLHLRQGDELSFDFLKRGVRAYLAIAGGIDVPPVQGSRSTHLLIGLGGVAGRSLRAGDRLPVGVDSDLREGAVRCVPEDARPVLSTEVRLRYVPGLFSYRLTDKGRADFEARSWVVTPNADRTGIRLSSAQADPLQFVDTPRPFGAGQDPSNVVDAGYPVGAIQIPSGTEPIVLARDAVTAGGYFTVGAVISTDLDLLGQCPMRGQIRFAPVLIEEATQARRQARAEFAQLLDALTRQETS